MKNGFKKLAIAGIIAGVLVVALAGTILAAGPSGGRDTSTGLSGYSGCGNGLGLGSGPEESVADLLGMTQEQIREQRQAGKSLVQIAATNNISEETLVNAITADRQEVFQKRLTAGTITQAQADQCLEQMKERVQRAVNRTTVGPPEWANANGNRQNGAGMRQGGLGGNQNLNSDGNCTGAGGMMRFGRTTS